MSLPVGIKQMIRDAVAMLDNANELANWIRPSAVPRYKEFMSRSGRVDPKNRIALSRLYVAYELALALKGQGKHQDADEIYAMIPDVLKDRFNEADASEWPARSEDDHGAANAIAAMIPLARA